MHLGQNCSYKALLPTAKALRNAGLTSEEIPAQEGNFSFCVCNLESLILKVIRLSLLSGMDSVDGSARRCHVYSLVVVSQPGNDSFFKFSFLSARAACVPVGAQVFVNGETGTSQTTPKSFQKMCFLLQILPVSQTRGRNNGLIDTNRIK